MLNGAHPFADGRLHHLAADQLGSTNHPRWRDVELRGGLSAPVPAFPGHGLSTIPCKSAPWLNHRGERIGPPALVTGFDTHWLCQRVANQEKPWTWHLLNWRIAAREFAISGAEHNQRIRDRQLWPSSRKRCWATIGWCARCSSKARIPGSRQPGRADREDERAHRLARHSPPAQLQATADAFDANFAPGAKPRTTRKSAASCMRASGAGQAAHLQTRRCR